MEREESCGPCGAINVDGMASPNLRRHPVLSRDAVKKSMLHTERNERKHRTDYSTTIKSYERTCGHLVMVTRWPDHRHHLTVDQLTLIPYCHFVILRFYSFGSKVVTRRSDTES